VTAVNVFDVAQLERFEELDCPRCDGLGRIEHPSLHDRLAQAIPFGYAALPCGLCGGEGRIWRLRPLLGEVARG